MKLIKEYKEGLKIFKCECGQTISKPKLAKEFKCIYCGAKEFKAEIPLPII
jgi:DNA-directed RNA polymerase subunit RPC12/RpoP